MQQVLHNIQLTDIFRKQGSIIDTLPFGKIGYGDYEYRENRRSTHHRILSGYFKKNNNNNQTVVNNSSYWFTNIDIDKYKEIYYLKPLEDKYETTLVSKQQLIQKLAVPARYGDVNANATLSNPEIRKGLELEIDNINVKINPLLLQHLYTIVRKTLSIPLYSNTLRIVPYKIHFYKEGDFFVPHRDSPEKDLLATIVVNLKGDSSCFVINSNVSWLPDQGNVCIFYTDFLHEIKPVTGERETITFRVFSDKQRELQNEDDDDDDYNSSCNNFVTDSDLLQKILSEHQKFGVLLQHGYIAQHLHLSEIRFKGLDLVLFNFLKQWELESKLNFRYHIQPVVVVQTSLGDAYSSRPSYSSSESEEEDGVVTKYRERINLYNFNNDQDLRRYLTIANLDSYFMDLLNDKTNNLFRPLAPLPVFYLGKGYMVGEKKSCNVHIGNQNTGEMFQNIYLNLLLVVETNSTLFCEKEDITIESDSD